MYNQLKMLILLSLTLLLVSCSGARMTQELQRGKVNFESGYYREAFQQLLPLATEGNKEAQYAVGYMYYYGYGVSQDTETGIFWIKKSADQHYPQAMQALQAMPKS
jgi:hypothetical protein